MKIGYARVSTQDQKLELQVSELEKYGCENIYKEKKSAIKDRPELDNMLAHLRSGDAVVVWKLDRLGRSLRHLINLVALFKEKGVDFISLNDNIDTTTIQGRLIFNIFASFAEFERELISERTKAGLKAAREKGRVGGRKPGLSDEAKTKAWAAHQLYEQGEMPVADILNQLHFSKATFYRYLEWAKENLKDKPKRKKKK
ncbi:Site-specific DNA recombinase [Reichenbachiella faecimaris]|uniref:Site-specific DNA recombinase n=1 Tax=Reichenbachiella faecimaris TaxID=692418 RepID=A0A1W2G6A5_REIFA|nr:recombinase family protein [Reichenbachiella faecimaris]SMD31826.1 Site-specific DNA recombinase [Reichenbachiella faecimaris]